MFQLTHSFGEKENPKTTKKINLYEHLYKVPPDLRPEHSEQTFLCFWLKDKNSEELKKTVFLSTVVV